MREMGEGRIEYYELLSADWSYRFPDSVSVANHPLDYLYADCGEDILSNEEEIHYISMEVI